MQSKTTWCLFIFSLATSISAFSTKWILHRSLNKLTQQSSFSANIAPLNTRPYNSLLQSRPHVGSSPFLKSTSTHPRTHTSLHVTSFIFESIGTFFQVAPYPAAFLTCGFKASAADFVAQKKIPSTSSSNEKNEDENDGENSNEFSFQRNLAFIVYGGMYQGCVQEFVYNHLFPIWFGPGKGVATVLSKVMFDMLVITPFVCLPIAYLVKAFVFQYSLKTGLSRYKDDVQNHGLLKKYWTLWFPVQCLTFSVIPEHFRIVFIACVSFFWLIILSSVSSRARTEDTVDASVGKTNLLLEENVEIIIEDNEECLLIDGITCNIDG